MAYRRRESGPPSAAATRLRPQLTLPPIRLRLLLSLPTIVLKHSQTTGAGSAPHAALPVPAGRPQHSGCAVSRPGWLGCSGDRWGIISGWATLRDGAAQCSFSISSVRAGSNPCHQLWPHLPFAAWPCLGAVLPADLAEVSPEVASHIAPGGETRTVAQVSWRVSVEQE